MLKMNRRRTDPQFGLTMPRRRPRPESNALAPFVSQLLSEQDGDEVASTDPHTSQGAIGAYAIGASMAVKRMPAGFRKTVVV
mgnify:CR=1 FL=1